MSHDRLTIVIIGRNEEPNLARTLQSLRAIEVPHQILYVDSASTDQSVDVARSFGVRVARLDPSDHLCAAAGRYVGTLLSRTEWILYLDGDMALTPEFALLVAELLDQEPRDPRTVGYVGLYVNAYDDGHLRTNVLRQRAGRAEARTFGGALLVQREAVEAAGNWDFRVSSYEELDLHTKLRSVGKRIEFVPTTMVAHHTSLARTGRLLARMFWPFGSRRMAGIGELICSRLENGRLLEFIRLHPAPFAYLGLLLAGIVALVLPFPGVWVGTGLIVAALLYGASTGGIRCLAVFLSFPLRVILGFVSYPRDWQPEYSVSDEQGAPSGG